MYFSLVYGTYVRTYVPRIYNIGMGEVSNQSTFSKSTAASNTSAFYQSKGLTLSIQSIS